MRKLLLLAAIGMVSCITDPSQHAVDVTMPVSVSDRNTPRQAAPKPLPAERPIAAANPSDDGDFDIRALLADTVSQFDNPLEEMPEPTQSIKVIHHGDYRKIFNDSNHVQWAAAQRYGITPLSDTRSHWNMRRPLVRIVSCADYYVEPLTYSRPYLVPEGRRMLAEIGRRFRDTLQARGGGDYRIKVTSILRTPESVARLRRRNRNAVDSSTHQFATTIDISYARFAADSDRIPRSVDDLKGLLAEVLLAMRTEGKLWVKYEHGQPCFHITVRGEAYQ